MDSHALTPGELFEGIVTYEIPPFQRPYVWTEEDQWQPFWDDIERLASSDEDEAGQTTSKRPPRHFLGAVVLKQVNVPAGDPTRRKVIDGQQRLTTLQLLLHAAHQVLSALGASESAESLGDLTRNSQTRFSKSNKKYKLLPSRIDRAEFAAVMDRAELSADTPQGRLAKAHFFFVRQMQAWAQDGDASQDVVIERLGRLFKVLHSGLQVVAINLDDSDDDQLIFETINDRGTPLLAADLVKNHVFQCCEDIGAPVDEWADLYWGDFDTDWWRKEVAQGRLYRSRIDIFLQYWLTMIRSEEVPTEQVFRQFRDYSTARLSDLDSASSFLNDLRTDADRYRELTDLDDGTAVGSFVRRVVEALELGSFTPLVLWMLRRTTSADAMSAAFSALESWAVRRTLLRRTMKDVNKLVVALLKELERNPSNDVGRTVSAFLASQTADARSWPSDDDVLRELPTARLYASIKQQRLRTVLGAVELHRRAELGNDGPLASGLQLEHVMPQGWRSHWNAGLTEDEARSRDALLDTLGNLTLVTAKLNRELSHRPWTDEDTTARQIGGIHPGRGKQWLLNHYSHLTITSQGVTDKDRWTEDCIRERSLDLTRSIVAVWPRPSA